MTSQQITELLGVDAVLIPIRKKLKKPYVKGWQKLTHKDTQEPSYQNKLKTHGNTGVSLGYVSQHLCSIDFDDDAALIDFITLNPDLSLTLRTQGKRGANLWIVLTGHYPQSYRLYDQQGNTVGEWRADGNQTIIQGTHPEGNPDRVLVRASPIHISYDSIQWGNIQFSKCHVEGIEDIDSQILQTNNKGVDDGSLENKIHRAEAARMELENNQSLYPLYKRYIGNRFTAKQGQRNANLVEMLAFLYRAIGERRTIPLVMAFYDLNQDVFSDTREQHHREAVAGLKAIAERWRKELSPLEQEKVAKLPAKHIEAFRICRDLQGYTPKGKQSSSRWSEYPQGFFALSGNELGKRIEVDCKTASRMLAQLEGCEIIKTHKPGTQRRKGQPGMATSFQWLLNAK